MDDTMLTCVPLFCQKLLHKIISIMYFLKYPQAEG